jgi:hypothetical protein
MAPRSPLLWLEYEPPARSPPSPGIAPKAWIGSYKVFGTPGVNDTTSDAAILKAIDDAVADGMDVINLSLGSDLAPRLDEDLEGTGDRARHPGRVSSWWFRPATTVPA